MARFRVTAPDGATYEVNAPEGATEQDAIAYIANQLRLSAPPEIPYERTYGDIASAAFNRGIGGIGTTLGDELPAYLASIFGADEYAKEQLAEAEQSRQSLEERFPTQFASYKDVKGIGDAAKYVTEQFLGSALPSIATVGATAGVAALAAPFTPIAAGTLGTIGTALGAFSLMAPESFAGIYQETGRLEPAAATIAGAVNTALETALPARIFGKLTAPVKAKVVENILTKSGMQPSIARAAVTETFKSAGLEGLTEGAQEAVNITAESIIAENPDVFGDENVQRVMESFVAGAAGGAPFGAVSGPVEVIRERSAAQEKERATAAEKLRLEKQIRETEAQKAAAEARFIIPTDPKLLKAWMKDLENLGVASKPLEKVLAQVAGKDIRDPAQAALVYKVLNDYANKTQSVDLANAIEKYLQSAYFEASRTGKPTTPPPTGTGTGTPPPTGTGTPPPPPNGTGTPPPTGTGTPPPPPTGSEDEEIAAALKAAAMKQEAEEKEAAARKDESIEEEETVAPTGKRTTPQEELAALKRELERLEAEGAAWEAANAAAATPTAPTGTDTGTDTDTDTDTGTDTDTDTGTDTGTGTGTGTGTPPPPSGTAPTTLKTDDLPALGLNRFDLEHPRFKNFDNMSAAEQAGALEEYFALEAVKLFLPRGKQAEAKRVIDRLRSTPPATPPTGTAPATPPTGTAPATPPTGTAPATPPTGTAPATIKTDDLPALGLNRFALEHPRFKNFDNMSAAEQAGALEEYFAIPSVQLNTSPEKQAEAVRVIRRLRGTAPAAPATPPTGTAPSAPSKTKPEAVTETKDESAKGQKKGRKKVQKEGKVKTKADLLDSIIRRVKPAILPFTDEGKYVLPSLLSPSERQLAVMVDESGKAMIDSLTKEVPWKTILDKIDKKEELTAKELAAWFFHTYEPTTALIVMEAEATSNFTLPAKRTVGETRADVRAALEFIDKTFSKTPNIQLVRAKIMAKLDALKAELKKSKTDRLTKANIEAMHLVSGFGRAVGLGDFYVGMGLNNTFDPSKSSDEVARNDKVDEEIYKEPGETEDAVEEGAVTAEQDELLTSVNSFKAFKAVIEANLEEGTTLENELKKLGITSAKQFKVARAEALQRRGNLSEKEAAEVVATGELVDAIKYVPPITTMSPAQKKELEDEITAQVQNFLRSGKTPEQLPAGPGGTEGGPSGQSRRAISYLRTPKFRGPDFNEAIRAAVEKGDIRAAINELIKSNSGNPDLVQLLRKLLPVVAKTKIVLDGGIPLFNSGMYVPETDSVHIDSISGMNEHTLLHEIFHAALARILGDPNHPLSQEFQKLFNSIKTQLGDAYGGTNMQEFGAELGGNAEFQALLKTIKAPRGGNFLQKVWQMLLEALGIRKRATAYDKAFKLVNDILDISVGLEPLPGEAMFLGGDPGKSMVDAMLSRKPGTVDEMLNRASKLTPKFLRTILGFVSLNNKENMLEGTEVQSLLRDYTNAIMRKKAEQDKTIDKVSKEYEEKVASVERNPKYAAAWAEGTELMIEARLAHVELADLKGEGPFEPKDAKQKAAYEKLKPRFDALPKEVRDAFTHIRQQLDDFLHEYVESIAAFMDSQKKQDEIRNEFYDLKGAIGYVPFMRFGDFWISFTDPVTKEYTAAAFESPRERATMVKELIKTYPELDGKITQRDSYTQMVSDAKLPPSSFIAKLEIELKKTKAPQETIELIKELYIRSYPSQTLLQQFKKAKGIPGMSRDLGRAYASSAGKWIYRITALKHNGLIAAKLATFTEEVKKQHGGDDFIEAIRSSVEEANNFVISPQVNPLSTALTQLSALEYIAGSFSSAAVNVTGLMFMVHPMLSARYGTQALGVLGNASLNPIKKLRAADGPYKELAEGLDALDLLRNPVSKEILNRGKSSLEDYSTLGTKIKEFLAWPFVKSEEYIRAATAIAAYNLALKGGGPFNLKPATQEEAIQYAAKVIQDAHTAGMSETAAPYLQHPVGRVILTFKSIVLAQAAYIGQQFRNWWKDAGDDPEAKQLKRFARRYLIYTYGTSFALLGAKGLPFMGATTALMRILELMIPDDDEEPYDPREQVNGVFGDFLYRGLFATILGIDVSERASLANDVFFRDDPQSIRDYGYVRTFMYNLFGPMGTYASNAERALKEIGSGQNIYKAVEDLSPAFVRNGMRGYRYYLDGVTTRTGSPVVEDVNLWQSMVQGIGFTPAEVGEIYEVRARAKTFETTLLDIKSRILDKYFLGKSTGDMELTREAQREAAEFRRKHPNLMNADTLERSYRSRVTAEEEKLAGLRFSKALLPDIAEKYFSD